MVWVRIVLHSWVHGLAGHCSNRVVDSKEKGEGLARRRQVTDLTNTKVECAIRDLEDDRKDSTAPHITFSPN